MRTYTLTITGDSADLEMRQQMAALPALEALHCIQQMLREHSKHGFRPTDHELEVTIGDRALTVAEMDVIQMVIERIRSEVNSTIYIGIPDFDGLVV